MRRPSIRGIGIRYALALTLPITGIALVLYTVVQLVSYSLQERRAAPRGVRAIAGSLGAPAGLPAAVSQAAPEASVAGPAVPPAGDPKR